MPTKIYSHHVANLRELELALGHTARLAREAIASVDPEHGLRSLLRLYSFLVGAWAECRLKKLLNEDGGFTAADLDKIQKQSSQLDQWHLAVELAFRKHHLLPKAELSPRTIGVASAARYGALCGVLDDELRIIIEIRNKLAHGQWIFPFNNTGTAVESDKYLLINKENFLSLQFKYSLIGHLADLIHDLIVSKNTFERDFESHFRKLSQVRTNLKTRDYTKYAASLVERRQRARATRKA